MAKSNITKSALANALKELMLEKNFSKITVANICDRCNMNRKSFYYHFVDKYELLNWIFETETMLILKNNQHQTENDLMRIHTIAEYLYRNKEFYKKAFEVEGQNSFSDCMHEMIFKNVSKKLTSNTDYKNISSFQIDFFTYAIEMSLINWIKKADYMTPEDFVTELELCMKFISDNYGRFQRSHKQ